jgi:hypothetical protein
LGAPWASILVSIAGPARSFSTSATIGAAALPGESKRADGMGFLLIIRILRLTLPHMVRKINIA